jgi:hypothetical protein
MSAGERPARFPARSSGGASGPPPVADAPNLPHSQPSGCLKRPYERTGSTGCGIAPQADRSCRQRG